MDFEIIGQIADVEIITTGGSIREFHRLGKIYGQGAGGSSRGQLWYGSRTASSPELRYTGMRRMALVGRRSESSAFCASSKLL